MFWASAAVFVVLSGCVSGPSAQQVSPGAAPASPHLPQFTDDTGALVVQVRTDELVPLAGALVVLADEALSGVTNALGEVGFDRLPPKVYEVHVSADGYHDAVREVEVLAGQATTLVFPLLAMPSTEPYVQVSPHVGKVNCDVQAYDNPYRRVGTGDYCRDSLGVDCHPDGCWITPMAPNWTAALLEGQFVPNGAFSAKGMSAGMSMTDLATKKGLGYIACPESMGWLRFAMAINESVDSRAHCPLGQVDRVPVANAPQMRISVSAYPGSSPTDFYVALDQKWTAYFSVFYHQRVPEGYTMRPDQ